MVSVLLGLIRSNY